MQKKRPTLPMAELPAAEVSELTPEQAEKALGGAVTLVHEDPHASHTTPPRSGGGGRKAGGEQQEY